MAASSHSQYPRSPNLSTRSYDSSSVSSATSPKPPQQYLGGLMSTSTRPNAAPPPHPIGIPPLPPVNHTNFHPYTPVTASSIMGRDSLPSTDSVVSTPGTQNSQIPPQSGQPPKRAYRQRRKDPSCDACRERKVKCDATETTSCSECSSRNVKCQFTKETNRRMSSIKQVQDLEKQIEKVRRENNSLRRLLHEHNGQLDVDVDGIEQLPLHLPEIASNPKSRKRPVPAIEHHHQTRSNFRTLSKGIWKAPAPYRQGSLASLFSSPRPELPSRQTADQLLHSYYSSFHTMMPILHWPTFQQLVENLYKAPTVQPSKPSSWSLFFAVLAVGCLFSGDSHSYRSSRAAELIEASRQCVDPWNNEHDLDNIRTLVLTTVFLNEMNLKTASSAWLGFLVRVAQDMGLHSETGPWPVIEGEMRRRIWWAVYILDRSLSLELGRPGTIDDSDCDVSLPAPVDDHFIQDGGIIVPNTSEPLTHSFLAIINVVRSYSALIKALATPVIAPTRLATFDQHFGACLRSFPPACDPNTNIPISAHFLAPLAYLLNARLLLHRHNLMPTCPPDVRHTAIEQCTYTALETASLLSRVNSSISDGATALVTTHVFRCALFLLLTGHFDQAGICIRVLGQLSNCRDVAIPCGRFLAFFSAALARKRAEITAYLAQTTPPVPQQPFAPPPPPGSRPGLTPLQESLLRDEELLLYASADLQANPDTAWVWLGSAVPAPAEPVALKSPVSAGLPSASALYSSEYRTGLTDDESREWGGWEHLENSVRSLASGTPSHTPSAPLVTAAAGTLPPIKLESAASSSAGPSGSLTGPSSSRNSPTAAPCLTSSSGSAPAKSRSQERISIANII